MTTHWYTGYDGIEYPRESEGRDDDVSSVPIEAMSRSELERYAHFLRDSLSDADGSLRRERSLWQAVWEAAERVVDCYEAIEARADAHVADPERDPLTGNYLLPLAMAELQDALGGDDSNETRRG